MRGRRCRLRPAAVQRQQITVEEQKRLSQTTIL